jgi:outer membrane biosynthesis protein TonB
MILAALCISALVQQQPGHSIAYRCNQPLAAGTSSTEETLPKAVAPPPETTKTAEPAPKPIPPKKIHHKSSAGKLACKYPKRLWHHRRGGRSWTTCG